MSNKRAPGQIAHGKDIAQAIGPGATAIVVHQHERSHPLPPTTIPPLPPNFVSRRREVEALFNSLRLGESNHTVALTAIHGMGGIGKTVLAQALCHDPRTKKLFPDGIIWQTVGKESVVNLEDRLRAVRRALGDTSDDVDNELDQYRMTIRDKKALVAIDDVWRVEDIEPWLADSPAGTCVLFTTRDVSIGNAVGAQQHWAELLTEEQAQDIFARYVRIEVERFQPLAQEIIALCGRLPLALSMVGAMLRDKPLDLWQHTLKLLKTADVAKIQARFPNYPYPSVFVAIDASVNDLGPVERERYLAFAVLLEEMAIPRVIQQALWGTDLNATAEATEALISRSLALREADGQSIRLHDLQLMYTRAQYANQEALSLIHAAIRLSFHVIVKDARQFTSQVLGRLLAHENQAGIREFTRLLSDRAPCAWLKLRHPALVSPGGPLATHDGSPLAPYKWSSDQPGSETCRFGF